MPDPAPATPVATSNLDDFDWTPSAPATPPAATPAAPTPSATPSEFLRVNDRTVYLTPDAARDGFLEAQRTIEAQRYQLQAYQERVRQMQPQNPLDALDISVRQNNPEVFQQALRQEVQQEARRLFQEALGPLAPTIGFANLNRAVEIASSAPEGDPNIVGFVRSPAFAELSKKFPTLTNAIEQARYDPRFAERELPELLVIAYRLAGQAAGAPAAAAPGVRQTTPSSTNPPLPVSSATQTGTAGTRDIPWTSISAADWATAAATQNKGR